MGKNRGIGFFLLHQKQQDICIFDLVKNDLAMVTVEMTEAEYKAYQLYLRSVKVMLESEKKLLKKSSTDDYLANPENIDALERGLRDVQEGRITDINPHKVWDDIK